MKKLQCSNCIENENSVFNVLSKEEKQILQEKYVCKKVGKGEVIFREGEYPAGLIALSSGIVKVFKEGVGGRDQIVRMAHPVSFIGYRALFAEEQHKATAVAIDDSVVCVINKESLYKVMAMNPSLTMSIIKSFATELGFTINRTVTLTQKHVRGRLAESLIYLGDTYGFEEDGRTIRAYLSREDIANFSSMTTSNAIRTLSSFASEGLVKLKGRKISIIDSVKLEKVSELG